MEAYNYLNTYIYTYMNTLHAFTYFDLWHILLNALVYWFVLYNICDIFL